jgi:hypothetical protein
MSEIFPTFIATVVQLAADQVSKRLKNSTLLRMILTVPATVNRILPITNQSLHIKVG